MRMEPILVVDDEHAIADLVCLTLENAGYRCKAAYSGAEAADKIETGRWALVVLDVMLPDHDGYELKTFIGDETPVIFLTAKTDVAQRVKGLAAGAQDYICKPFEPPELVASLEAEATVIMAKARHRAMARANSRLIFFIQYMLLFIIKINCVTPESSG